MDGVISTGLQTGVHVPPHEPDASPHSAVWIVVTTPPTGHVSEKEMLAFGLLVVDPPDLPSPQTIVGGSGGGDGGGLGGGGALESGMQYFVER